MRQRYQISREKNDSGCIRIRLETSILTRLSIFKNVVTIRVTDKESGLFDLWRRFGSVTGFSKPAPSPKPRQSSKILAPNWLKHFFKRSIQPQS
jgi:hypothetical protein